MSQGQWVGGLPEQRPSQNEQRQDPGTQKREQGWVAMCCIMAAGGQAPRAEELVRQGVQTFSQGAGGTGEDQAGTTDIVKSPAMVPVGVGLPALPKKLVEKMKAGEYVDMMELPPAKGKSRAIPQALEGQVIMVDLASTKKVVPDLATWSQCFAIYVAVVAAHQPDRLAELMAYQASIAKASKKFKWPSWVIYDQNFRQEAAGNPGQSWAKVDPSIYAQCFTGQARSAENWCMKCQGLDHPTEKCPSRPRKRSWSSALGGAGSSGRRGLEGIAICQKYNKYDGDCKFAREGKTCRYDHICSTCKDPSNRHPATKCRKGDSSNRGRM